MEMPVRKWSCPNHELSHWEGDSEAVALVERCLDDPVLREQAERAAVELGLCCREAEWETVGTREATPFEEMLRTLPFAPQPSVDFHWNDPIIDL